MTSSHSLHRPTGQTVNLDSTTQRTNAHRARRIGVEESGKPLDDLDPEVAVSVSETIARSQQDAAQEVREGDAAPDDESSADHRSAEDDGYEPL